MNKVILIGNMTKDADLKYTPSGKAVATFTLAVKRPFTKDKTDFLNCVAWDKKAEVVAEWTQKGSKIAITGYVSTRDYQNNEGRKIYVTEFVADEIEFLDKKPAATEPKNINQFEDLTPVDESDIPF